MRSEEFVVALQDAMPPSEELEAHGLGPDEIASVQATFRPVPRESHSISGSELEKMILDYDCSSVEVGLIRFLDRPQEFLFGTQVAVCEADPIVVSPSGAVQLLDHANPADAMGCAADSEMFLEALSAFLAIRREKSKWKGRVNAAAEVCAQKAGGSAYAPFFQLLCSFLRTR